MANNKDVSVTLRIPQDMKEAIDNFNAEGKFSENAREIIKQRLEDGSVSAGEPRSRALAPEYEQLLHKQVETLTDALSRSQEALAREQTLNAGLQTTIQEQTRLLSAPEPSPKVGFGARVRSFFSKATPAPSAGGDNDAEI